jgi:hypothetical protein
LLSYGEKRKGGEKPCGSHAEAERDMHSPPCCVVGSYCMLKRERREREEERERERERTVLVPTLIHRD